MKFFATSVAAVSLIPSILALTINTPSSLTVCQPTLLSWSDGTAPYYLSIIPGGETSSSALKTFDTTNSTSYTWTVDISAGTAITVELKDSTGTIAYSDEVTIQSGTDDSCVTTSVSASASAGSASAGSSATSSSGSSATVTSSSGSSTTSSTTASSSSTSNAALQPVFNYGAAGLLGLIGALIL
ncbi:hypothetical protein GYMLUDRAFT_41445 [Collybiopsis luxurians FD-317 M1]|uniref:Unplaced genomic scaffold GYMLUscaffold_17, whole genome shotgun sequence n=1 Tax=Collybiopsis luxurians FD-317 M1 TaxID=944289 RepID=A0A0D0C4R9_9AGAR|nr:hypothetical protein GYMLUDRAFT_41445 [Collybiopsis luxurians FD-317 M1]